MKTTTTTSDAGGIAWLIKSIRLMQQHLSSCPMCEGVVDPVDKCPTCKEMDLFLSGSVVPIPEEGFVILASLPGKEKKLSSLYGPLFTTQREAELYHRDQIGKDIRPLTRVFRVEVYIREEVTGSNSVLGVGGNMTAEELRDMFRQLDTKLRDVLAKEVDDWIVTQSILTEALQGVKRQIDKFITDKNLGPEFVALFEQITVDGDVGRVRDGGGEGSIWIVYPDEMRRYLPKI